MLVFIISVIVLVFAVLLGMYCVAKGMDCREDDFFLISNKLMEKDYASINKYLDSKEQIESNE